MAPSLLSLSEELLTRIVDFVEYSSLPSLTLVNQTLNRLTTPHIYADVSFKGALIDTGVKYLVPFTFLMLQKPNIASLVLSFSIRDSCGVKEMLMPLEENGDGSGHMRKGWPHHPDLKTMLRRAMEDIENDEEQRTKLFEEVHTGSDEGAILSILLPKLPNLRKLDLVYWSVNDNRHLLRLLHKVTKRETPFDREINLPLANLSDVLIAGYDDKYPNAPDWVGAYLELPSIRRLHGYQLGNNDQDEVTPMIGQLGEGISTVEELELRESKLFSEDLERVLKACKNLKTFIYKVGHAWAWYPLCTPDITKALSPQKEALENMVLEHPYWVEAMDDDDLSPVSWAAFKKLAYLKISTLFLGGEAGRLDCDLMGTFPATLQALHITNVGDPLYCAKTMDALQNVLERKEQMLPNLKKLTLEGEFDMQKHPERLDSVKEIVRCARARDIETVVVRSAQKGYSRDLKQRAWGLYESIHWQECINNYMNVTEILDIEGFGW